MNTQEIEKRIITQVAESLIQAGYWVRVYDGEEWASDRSRDFDTIIAETFATDVTRFYAYTSGSHSVEHFGWVEFVHGNGTDVITNSTVSLESVLEPAEVLACSLGFEPV